MTMIEKVARAICNKDGNDWDFKNEYIELAKAAIEAMREPTDEMISAVTRYSGPHYIIYCRMIDAALKED